ncbi:hypothetical protein [Burkholderia sp. SCN-KJ]|uniref:hypothetical protein n=1 Tax=Burkholderia sp. SCN-KJ TaxID=2969248 RepID=UPI00214FA385|nr:hypothetical protein [Burkholderia sp. SCN-KJ]MCR4466998.1 hypothetical protein [Burkholderia sp. SCN-KJ]
MSRIIGDATGTSFAPVLIGADVNDVTQWLAPIDTIQPIRELHAPLLSSRPQLQS